MTKKVLLVICFIAGGMMHSQTKNCECGDYEQGRTFFQIVDEDGVGCCSGTATGDAMFVAYEPSEDGTWIVSEVSLIENTTAQDNCCGDS